MARVKAIIDKHGGTTKLLEKPTGRKDVRVLKAQINLNGRRAVDTAKITVDANVHVERGDVIKYIQDDVNTEGLRGFYNFINSPRDESGNDADETNDQIGDYQDNNRTGWSRNINQYLDLRANAIDWIEIKSEKMIEDATEEVINMSGKFDIFVWFRILGTPTAEVNSIVKKMQDDPDTNAGFEMQWQASYFAKAKLWSGGSQITGSPMNGTTALDGTIWHLFRLRRDEADDIRLYVDGVQEGATVNSSADFTNTQNMRFGEGDAGLGITNNTDLGQVRIYCGVNLTDDEADKLLKNKRQHSIMKFGGTIYKIDEKTSHKIVHAKGWGKVLAETEASQPILDARDESASNNGIDNTFIDDSGGVRMTPYRIMQQTMIALDSDNTYRKWLPMHYNTTEPTTPQISTHVLSGNLLTNFQLLNRRTGLDEFFLTTPRKIFNVGDVDDINEAPDTTKGYLFINGLNCKMTKTGRDDTKLINSIEIVGENLTQRKIEHDTDSDHAGGSLDWDVGGTGKFFELRKTPIGTVTVTADSVILDEQVHEDATLPAGGYKLRTRTKEVELQTTPATSLTIEYEYEDSTNEIHRQSNSASIQEYGLRHRRIFIGGAKDLSFITNLAANIINVSKDVNERVTLELPWLANEISMFHECTLENKVKDGSGGNTALGNGVFRVFSMTFLYPAQRTIINFGEHVFDAYDYDIVLAEKHREASSVALKSKNA